ncbi:MAG: TIGR00730 family Rossman fold protein [Aliidongia sp.]
MAEVRSLCVYCGSSNVVAPKFLEAAYALGRLIGRAGIGLVYGGGRVGLMGRVADGALAEGGKVTGIIPHHLHQREIAHGAVKDLILVDSMHERKQRMAELSDAFAIMPGGYGTLDEMFEILTWRQLGLHDKPIVLVDLDGYWQTLERMVDHFAAEGFISPTNRALYQRVESIDEVLPALAAAQPPKRALDSDRL